MAERGLRRYARPFRHRDFRLLVFAFLVDSIGSWASNVVIAVWIYERTGSVALIAVQTAASWIPGLLLAPIAGVLADRYDRRAIMMTCATLSGVVMTGTAVTVAVNGPYFVILLLQVASAAVRSPYQPAAGALTPEVVDEAVLPTANSLFSAIEELVVVIGPALGGVLLLTGAPWIGVAINAASFFLAAVVAAALRVRSRGGAGGDESVVGQFLAGARAFAATPTAAVLLAFAALDSLVANMYSVIYIPISRHVGLGTNGYGYLLAGAALGGVLGAGLAERLSAARRLAPVIVGALLVQVLPYAATAFTGNAAIAVVLQMISGAGMVVVDVLALTAIQREVPSGALSRVLSLLDMGVLVAGIVGSFAVAGLLAVVPYSAVLLIVGGTVSVVAVALAPLVVRADRRAASVAAALAQRVGVFEQIDLLRDVARSGLERLAAAAVPLEVPAGGVLLREGDTADAIYVLIDGSLAVTALGTGHVGDLPPVRSPDLVGEIGVLRGLPRTATLTAASPARLLRIDGRDYLAAITPERIPVLFAGRPSTRLARTHPELLATPPE